MLLSITSSAIALEKRNIFVKGQLVTISKEEFGEVRGRAILHPGSIDPQTLSAEQIRTIEFDHKLKPNEIAWTLNYNGKTIFQNRMDPRNRYYAYTIKIVKEPLLCLVNKIKKTVGVMCGLVVALMGILVTQTILGSLFTSIFGQPKGRYEPNGGTGETWVPFTAQERNEMRREDRLIRLAPFWIIKTVVTVTPYLIALPFIGAYKLAKGAVSLATKRKREQRIALMNQLWQITVRSCDPNPHKNKD